MTQFAIDLDARTHARTTDPDTSHEAARRVCDLYVNHCEAILAALRDCGPMGKTRLAVATNLDDVAVARRLSDLHRAGRAEPTGGVEKSASGRAERVWRAL